MDAVVDVLVDMLYVVIALMFVCKFAKMLPLTNIMLHSHLSESDRCVLQHDMFGVRKPNTPVTTHLLKSCG